MNKTAIEQYAVWARNELIGQVKQRAYQYGITDKGYGDEGASVINEHVLTPEEKRQRKALIREIQKKGYLQTVEDVAYTWFNRFVALRFMEVNDYLPSRIRVFSDASGGFNPEILQDVMHLHLEGLDKKKVSELLNANRTEELYRYLLLTQCNALNSALPEMFEKLGSYTEMLLPNNILKQDSVLARLVNDIDEGDWKEAVQIIGWMYQYYNTEPKQAVFDGLKKNIKITKEKVPAATQLFTPDWIVRYMVENSLGRLWLENHPDDRLKANWKYYLDEAEQTPEVTEQLRILRSQSPVKSPEDIKLIDPCMGSGHILVYAFDVLMQIYVSEGYNPRETVKLILEKNLYGLDIDRRAYQLAYFSLMMKARQYNRRTFTDDVKPQVYYPAGFPEGEEYGSLVKVEALPSKPEMQKEKTLFDEDYETVLNAWNFQRLLAQKYDVVVTNPPYMGGKGMTVKLSDFVKKNYPDSKSDLFAVFIEKCGELLKATGYQAMITQHAWMFLSSYEKLRSKLMHRNIMNMAHLGARAFEEIGGEVVQTTTFVLAKHKTPGFKGTYVRLVEYSNQDAKEEAFLCGYDRYTSSTENFEKIPGSPVAYWVSDRIIDSFSGQLISDVASSRQGMATGENNRFLRLWSEVVVDKCGFNMQTRDEALKSHKKWFPYNKGGDFRKWYGNNEYFVNWENDGEEICNFKDKFGKLRS
ncbi:MAG: BREX-1 system adenine-specific DNA-methyltransferase PglX, partial [Lentisphaerae bacterium]|nr:BREX-1 system adenine-specific DNA-methyltransferase PglX [Lentisphaerota bacterium]